MHNVIKPIGYIRAAYKSKFGIPRQAGIVASDATIEFLPEYGVADAFRGIEEFTHIWLLWEFSECVQKSWSPTVRPPRLGGNKRVGVFATRSPFRPNSIGLSCVRLCGVECADSGVILHISGADLMDGTPIYDIKPYLPYTDCHSDASGGFTDAIDYPHMKVELACNHSMPEHMLQQLTEVLAQDPRPSYHNEPDRVYGMDFDKYNIKFKIDGECVTVVSINEVQK